MVSEGLAVYDQLARKSWDRMVAMVGVHTVMILAQRAVWLTRQNYEEADAIRLDEDGLSLLDLAHVCDEDRAGLVAGEFFTCLFGILSRLVGQEMARKMSGDLDLSLQGGGDPG